MTEIKIGGRVIPLYYSTFEMIAIQEEVGCTSFELNDKVFGIVREDEDNPEDVRFDIVKDKDKIKNLSKLIRILGNAGLEEKGEEPDLTEKWILRNIKPPYIIPYSVMVLKEIYEGNKMETPAEENKDTPVDEGLEEINAKKQQGN